MSDRDFDLTDAYAVETPDDNRDLYARWAATYESTFVADNGYVYHLGVVYRPGGSRPSDYRPVDCRWVGSIR